MSLKSIIEDTDTQSGRIFDWFIQCVILISIIAGSLETVKSLSPLQTQILGVIETVSIAIFTIELILRLWTNDRGIMYLLTFYGLIDLLAILPYYLSLTVDLRGLRAFRVFRVFRLLKMSRYNSALGRLKRAFANAKEELILFGCISLLFIFLSANGIYYFESEAQPDAFGSIPECIWWAVVTLTTVGYGDSYPATAGGKLFTFLILSIGLAIIAIPSGIIATSLAETKDNQKGE
jgi:voltage-gated potassium channel